MPQSPEQTDFESILDGKTSVGVFYFPETDGTQADQISALEVTIRHLQSLRTVVEETKIKGGAAPKYARLLRWLTDFESHLQTEKEKLLELNPNPEQSMPDSMRPKEIPAAPDACVTSDAR